MSSKALLIILGLVGVSALLLGAKNDSDVREDYMLQFPMKSQMDRVVVSKGQQGRMSGSLGGNAGPQMTALNFAEYPLFNQKGGVSNPYTPVEPYRQADNVRLGSSAVTKDPYVSYPAYQQSTPIVSPNISLPPMIRYKPPSLSQMGISEQYKCQGKPAQVREGYSDGNVAGGYMDMLIDPANPNPGPDFTAGNYKKATGKEACINPNMIDGVNVGNLTGMSATGQQEQVMIFDRPMTTTSKPGRTCQNGVRDMIRGELAVMPDVSHIKWFQASAKPTDLQTGALQAMAGTNEHDLTLANMMATYGGLNGRTMGGSNMDQWGQGQQTVPQQMLSAGTGINQNTAVVSFS